MHRQYMLTKRYREIRSQLRAHVSKGKSVLIESDRLTIGLVLLQLAVREVTQGVIVGIYLLRALDRPLLPSTGTM